MAKKVIDGKCPHCGSSSGYMVTHTERVVREFTFGHESLGVNQQTMRSAKQARCMNCGNAIDVGRKEFS